MSVTAKISGDAKLAKFFESLDPAAREMFVDGLKKIAVMIHSVAVKSIVAHESQGKKYGSHVASAPGYPPNSDTGQLVNNIKWEIDEEKLTAQVGTNLWYGEELEVGSTRVAARPWLKPAYEKIRPTMIKIFRLRVKR